MVRSQKRSASGSDPQTEPDSILTPRPGVKRGAVKRKLAGKKAVLERERPVEKRLGSYFARAADYAGAVRLGKSRVKVAAEAPAAPRTKTSSPKGAVLLAKACGRMQRLKSLVEEAEKGETVVITGLSADDRRKILFG